MVDEIVDTVSSSLRRAGVDAILQLPCGKIEPLLGILAEQFYDIPLTREEEGPGIAAGISLAGKKTINDHPELWNWQYGECIIIVNEIL